jgi:PAS domain S-box-containing protein
MSSIHLLLIEDSDDDALLVVTHLRRGGIELTYECVQTSAAVTEVLTNRPPDIVICDYNLPSFSPEDALDVLHDADLDIPFILVSGQVGEETAASVMRAGAHDFILKDRLTRLVPAVQRELRDVQVRRQRRQTETALRESEERFRLLAEHVQDVIFRCQLIPRLRLEYVSPAVSDLTGYSPEELYEDPSRMFAMAEPEDREAFEQSWRAPDPRARVVAMRRRDGELAWIEQRAVGIRDENGEVLAVEGILRDVTDKILADREREQLARELRQTERLDSLGRLAGGVAHDFNNLLAVIMIYAADVTTTLPLAHPCRPDVEKISQAAERAAALTRQLLIFSRLEPSQPETLDLNAVVTAVEDLLRRTIGEDIEFLTTLQRDLRPVTVDRSKLEQVLVNLVVNARAAMPEGGQLRIETSDVLLSSTDTDNESNHLVRLTVADTGCGMEPEVAQRAFEPFFTTKGPGQGTGLGLATAYGVVKEAGGKISLRSTVEVGTTVEVVLPAAKQLSVIKPVSATVSPSGAGQTILVVEDDEAVRHSVIRILTRSSYEVSAAATPKEAMEICANPFVHLDGMLTDVVMPEMSGPQLAERVRQLRPELPILLMSGYTAGSVPGGEEFARGLPLIRKPFGAAALVQKIQELLA